MRLIASIIALAALCACGVSLPTSPNPVMPMLRSGGSATVAQPLDSVGGGLTWAVKRAHSLDSVGGGPVWASRRLHALDSVGGGPVWAVCTGEGCHK